MMDSVCLTYIALLLHTAPDIALPFHLLPFAKLACLVDPTTRCDWLHAAVGVRAASTQQAAGPSSPATAGHEVQGEQELHQVLPRLGRPSAADEVILHQILSSCAAVRAYNSSDVCLTAILSFPRITGSWCILSSACTLSTLCI